MIMEDFNEYKKNVLFLVRFFAIWRDNSNEGCITKSSIAFLSFSFGCPEMFSVNCLEF